MQIVEGSPEQGWIDKPGGVFLRRADLMPPEDRVLLEAAARVVMDGADGDLRQQLKRPHIPLGPDPGLFNEYHALIVHHAKAHCRVRPRCDGCVLRERCTVVGPAPSRGMK